MLFAAMSDGFWQYLFGFTGLVGLALITLWGQRMARKDASEAKESLIAENIEKNRKLDAVASRLEETHTLVNGNMTAALTNLAAALRRVADLTHDPADEEAARAAETALAQHEGKAP